MKERKTEKIMMDETVSKIQAIAKELGLNQNDLVTISKIGVLRYGKQVKSPLHAAELTLKEVFSIASKGEVAPNDIELNTQEFVNFFQSDDEFKDKVQEEIEDLLNGETDG